MLWMHSKRFQFYLNRIALVTCILSLPILTSAQSNSFLNKTVKVVVTYPAGGSSDLITRIVGQKLTEIWSQPVVIENRTGTAGSIGIEYAANQPRDGYVLTIANLGVEPIIMQPEEAKKFFELEKAKYAKLIKDNNIKAE